MNRLFGTAKAKAPKPTLDGASKSLQDRGSELEGRIKTLDQELARYTDQMRKMKPGPAKASVQQRALGVLKQQKKMYEAQRDKMSSTQFNMDQIKFAQDSMVDTVSTVSAMKDANAALKKQFKSIDINKVEDLQDDMSDLLEQSNEIQSVLGRSYNLEDVDESALEDELRMLEEVSMLEAGALGSAEESGAVADYLTLPSAEKAEAAVLPEVGGAAGQAAQPLSQAAPTTAQ
ncbi:Snf7-domain-containing protein [Pavlovales sp. CCMP2436]|nr:Snf7-domain-containing protein [Pavlovales sp. CCMP2436]